GRDLNANYTHASVVTTGAGVTNWTGVTNIQGRPCHQHRHRQGGLYLTHNSWARVDIWRAPARLDNFASDAARVAATWSKHQAPKMPFSTRKAFMAGFGGSNFGTEAMKRCKVYYDNRNQDGGPESLHNNSVQKSMFCSMFVVACFQAAMSVNHATAEMN